MDGSAASVVNSTLRISQIVYEFKAVGEQARDLLASTNHVSKAIETTRTLRRQKSAHLASTEKEWIDSTIADAERTLNNVAALVEPVRVDMQTKLGKIGIVNRGMFVFRDSPKVLTHLNQLSMTHVSLVNALNTLSQRQVQLPPTPAPTLDRRASYASIPRPPTYEESEFLDRRRWKLRPKPSQVTLAEEPSDAPANVSEDGANSQHASGMASSSARLSSPAPPSAVYINDEKCLPGEIIECSSDPGNAPAPQLRPASTSIVELEAGPYNTRPRPQTYQAYCPPTTHIANGSDPPWYPDPYASCYGNIRHSMPVLAANHGNHAPINPQGALEIGGRDCGRRDPELHVPQMPSTASNLASPHSSHPSPHPGVDTTSLFPISSGKPYEMPSRPASSNIQQTPPYPDHTPNTHFSYSPSGSDQLPPSNTGFGLGVRLSGTVPPSLGYQRAQSYPGPAHAPSPLPHGAAFPNASCPGDPAAAHPPIERSISHDLGSLSRRRRYEWLEYHAG